jgi:hypothetical protein
MDCATVKVYTLGVGRACGESPEKGGVAVDGLCDNEGVHSWGGTGMWRMRVCELWA